MTDELEREIAARKLAAKVANVTIIQDARGFWARDDGYGYTIDRTAEGKPYLCCTPLITGTNEPGWQGTPDASVYTWGEPSFGCLEPEVEEYLYALQARLIDVWRKLGEPKGAGIDDDAEAARAWEARRIACEICGQYGEPENMSDYNGGPAHAYCIRVKQEGAHNG